MRGVRVLAIAAALVTYGLIVLGALVRSTNSGLSCPDWPTCYGQWVLTPGEFASLPATGYTYGQVMLEWAHRLIAGVFLGPLVLALAALVAWHRRKDPVLLRGALALILLLLVQGGLGGLTVLDQNSAWSVALHLGTALLVFATLLWMVVRSGALASPAPPGRRVRGLLPLATIAWLAAILAMITAAMTAKTGASLACATWPSCNGTFLPSLDDPLVRIHFAHRMLAAVTGVALLALFLVGRRAAPRLRRLTLLSFLLVLGEIGLGALVIAWAVPTATAVLHQAVGVLTFAVVTLTLWTAMVRPRSTAAGRGDWEGSDGYALQGT